MIGLDVTLQALATAPIRERMAALGPLGSALLLPALAQYNENPDPAVHDVCAVASIAVPDVFGYTSALVQVETTGQLTSGMTVTDFSTSAGHNAHVATSIDADRFWDVVLEAYAKVAAGLEH
jgi:purine nucleosidase